MVRIKLLLTLIAFHLLPSGSIAQIETSDLPDQMPYFSGCSNFDYGSKEKRMCSDRALGKYIANNLSLPEEARELRIEGLVYISFFISKTGEVKDAYILKDIGGGCGILAKDVVDNMPHWEPARKNNLPVAVQMSLPIKFSFSDVEKRNKGYFIKWGNIIGKEIHLDELKSISTSPIELRDINGNLVAIHELILSVRHGQKENILKNRKGLSSEMKKLIRKLKPADEILISVSYQKEGSFYDVLKEFVVSP